MGLRSLRMPTSESSPAPSATTAFSAARRSARRAWCSALAASASRMAVTLAMAICCSRSRLDCAAISLPRSASAAACAFPRSTLSMSARTSPGLTSSPMILSTRRTRPALRAPTAANLRTS